ncbi:transcriptional elongation regulator Elc1/Elongin C [Tricharina praecox]|uniref:transcriptional elongation regulator Elc1/Elongin C n=1 Tax=Tricharina praecox TaxID=43433 RepID=UPI00221E6C41|nr:transcriptional elongation regulator Elc1/Elongin C [Tricharina praecox]KAI5848059.1 transcriptional elongation regulator Elc1/Elongin C [Tricharina praecox]
MADNENPTVLLESNDGFQFIVRKSAAMKSSAIKGMLNKRNNFTEAIENRIVFQNMSGAILEKVCQYFYHYEKYKGSKEEIPEPDFITPELALELLFISDFLDC